MHRLYLSHGIPWRPVLGAIGLLHYTMSTDNWQLPGNLLQCLLYGEMAERLKAHAWKACVRGNSYRGFESLSLRHEKSIQGGAFFVRKIAGDAVVPRVLHGIMLALHIIYSRVVSIFYRYRMIERADLPYKELFVATAHDLLMTPQAGQPHQLTAPRDDGMFDEARIVRAAERRVPRQMLTVELEGGQLRALPLFEVSYTGLANEPDMRRLLAGPALDTLIVASRIGGRYLHRTGMDVQDAFGHPANIIRDPATGALLSAERIGVPQPIEYRGPGGLDMVNTARLTGHALRLVNYLPEDMYLVAPGSAELLQVSNCGRVADVNYQYEPYAQTAQGVVIAKSVPVEVTGMPDSPGRDELRLVHTEVLFESLRLGIASPEEASRMVVACGVRRMPSGQQGNSFSGLAYYDFRTLEEIYQRIRI
jgi:hypothetical protein